MAGAIGLVPGVGFGIKALAEVVAAAAVSDQAKVPCADGKLLLVFLLEQGHQLSSKLRKYLAHKRMLGFHGKDHNRGERTRSAQTDQPSALGFSRQQDLGTAI